jgi:hypothetical protein
MISNWISLNCPSCKFTLQIINEYPGSSYKCEHCNKYHAIVREKGKILALTPGVTSVEYASAEKHENMQCLLERIEYAIPLGKWGFVQSEKFFVNGIPRFRSFKIEDRYPAIIYNSTKCRVFFTLDYSGKGRSYAAFIYYGRLHAPKDSAVLNWNNESYYCWHSIEDFTLSFLDGLSPSEAINKRTNPFTELVDYFDFENSGTADIQYPLKLHAAIWAKYGNKLFDLFDLNSIEIWSQYTEYIKQIYSLRGSVNFDPELYKIR